MKVHHIVLLTALLFLAGCHSSAPSTRQQQPAMAAEILTVVPSNSVFGVTLTGVVHPRLEADIAAQVIGPIAAITKHEGDNVHRGEILVRLHATALNAGVTQASAAVNAAERQSSAAKVQVNLAADTLARYQQLRENRSVTPHELEQMQAQSEAAQAQENVAIAQVAVTQETLVVQRANAADAVLIAPFDGVVTQRMADPGAMALPGVPLLHLQSRGDTEVQFSMPDAAANAIHLGQQLPVTVDQNAQTARVTMISPAGDATSYPILVKAALPKLSSWKSGTVVSVTLPGSHADTALLVPTGALVEQGGLTAALVLNITNHAEVRYVTVGQKLDDHAEMLTGLQPGDRILAHGNLNYAGCRIEVRP